MYLLFYIFERLKLILLMKFCLFVVLSLLVFSACKKKEIVKGCTNGSAVNYNPEAKYDDGSCHFHYYESDSIESALLSPTHINFGNFTMYRAFIAVKNLYSITSNYGYEGAYSKGSAFAYEGSMIDGSPFSYTIFQADCESDTNRLSGFSQLASGGYANSVFDLDYDCYNNLEFVNLGKITSGDVTISQGYEFKFDGLTDISSHTNDSLIFGFHRGVQLYIKKAVTTNNSYIFTSNELATLSSGKGYIEVIGMNSFAYYEGSLPHYRISQTIRTKKVNFY